MFSAIRALAVLSHLLMAPRVKLRETSFLILVCSGGSRRRVATRREDCSSKNKKNLLRAPRAVHSASPIARCISIAVMAAKAAESAFQAALATDVKYSWWR